MTNDQFEMTVCVNGRPIREYGHRGLTFVEGRKGQTYSIKLRNNSARRILAVLSVDGLDVVNGQAADDKSAGYIIPAYSSAEIKGWRTSKSKVNDFVFDPKEKAYSTQSQSDDANCGVIAVKVFDEVVTFNQLNVILRQVTSPPSHHHHHHHTIWEVDPFYPPFHQPFWCMGGSTGTPHLEPTYEVCNNSLSGNVTAKAGLTANFVATNAPVQENPEFNLGTGWGAERVDEVEEEKFSRGLELSCFSIYYSDAEGLKAAGIELDKKPAVSKPVLPKGFNGFCKPPVVTSS